MLASEVVAILDGYRERRKPISFDIEGYCNWVTCYSIADSKDEAVVVPIIYSDGTSVWDEGDEILIWKATAALLEDPLVPKILQNFLYDGFVLAWSYGIVIQGLQDDTMVKAHELMAEMEKGLGFLASIYTKEPFYKAERKSTDEMTQLVYCGKDACVTFEINDVMNKKLLPQQRKHYEWQVSLLTPLLYMMLRGIRFDSELAAKRLKTTNEEIFILQDQINREAASGRPALQAFYKALAEEVEIKPTAVSKLPTLEHEAGSMDSRGTRLASLLSLLTTAFCKANPKAQTEVTTTTWQPHKWNGKKWVRKGKRVQQVPEGARCFGETDEPPNEAQGQVIYQAKHTTKLVNLPAKIETFEDVRSFAKDSCRADCNKAIQLLKSLDAENGLTAGQRGELSTLLGIHLKLNATGRGKDVVAEDGTTTKGDERDANWFVYEHCKAPKQFKREKGAATDKLTSSTPAVLRAYIATEDPRLKVFMAWRDADTRSETLRKKADPDGRMRCSYTLPGTETNRLSCSESPTGSGFNLQTVTESLRDLFPADEGCEFGNFDLRGADGYSIAAQCKALGDDTMLLDLLANLKPVNIIVLLYTEGPHINKLSREELAIATKRVAKESWQYIATKPIFYGFTYLMGARKMSEGIAEDSYAETGVPVVVSPKRCEEIMAMIDLRYPGIKRVQAQAAQAMMREGVLHTTVGWSRRFFGRKSAKTQVRGVWVEKPDRTTHGAWLSTLPQFNTTYATKMGLAKLWADPDNRREDGSLKVEPLHTVHDSLNTQWRTEDHEFAKGKMLPVWMNNSFNVAGTEMVIPASGTYGPSWGQQSQL